MVLQASEVALALHCAIILAFSLLQDNSYPFPGGKQCIANVGHSATMPLSNDLHHRAHLHWVTSSIRTHSAAATASGLKDRNRKQERETIRIRALKGRNEKGMCDG